MTANALPVSPSPRSPLARSLRRRPRFALRPLALAAGSLLSLVPGLPAPARAQAAPALPSGLTVIQGQVKAVTTGKQLTVTNSPNSILNWQSFSIGAGNGVTFVQPSATSQVLNRVVGNDPSSLLGSLTSNGRVWLLNPNGVLFGHGARIDVAGLVTSTLNLNDVDWLNGHATGLYPFSGGGSAGIVNQGELRSSLGGHIALLGGNVRNEGLIEAPGGQVLLAAGSSIDLVDTGSPNLRLRVTAPAGEALNLGTLAAAGGRIDVHAAVVNQQGVVRADSLSTNAAGEIVLKASSSLGLSAGSVTSASGAAGGKITLDSGSSGTTLVHGTVTASGSSGGGGQVLALGRHVGLVDAARIDVSAAAGGGQVLVGGGERGQDAAVPNAEAVYVGPEASIAADATGRGDGGRIVLWGDKATRAYGSFSARGGSLGGNGGFIETSGGWIDVRPARLDASAPAGLAGTWLLDPFNIRISDDTSLSGITTGGSPTDVNFTSSADDATIDSSVITGLLTGGSNVVVATGAGGTQPGDITVSGATLAVAPSTAVTLSLQAHGSIVVSGSTLSSSGAPLNLDFQAGGSGSGNVVLSSSNVISTAGGNVVASGIGFPSENFQSGFGVFAASDIAAGTGTISLTGTTTSTNFGAGVVLNFAALSGGTIRLTGTSASGTATATGVRLSGGSLTAGNIVVDGTANGSNGFSTGVDISGTLLSAAQSLSVTGTGIGTGVSTSNGAVLELTGSGTLSVTGTSTWNDFESEASFSNYGVDISGQYGGQLRSAGGSIVVQGNNNGAGDPSLSLRGNGSSLPLVDAAAGTTASLRGNNNTVISGQVVVGGPIQLLSDDVLIETGSSLRSTATGDALVVAGSNFINTTGFVNQAGATAFDTPNGRWLVYGQNTGSVTAGGLVHDFKQYNALFGTTPVAAPGNGLLYAAAPVVTVDANNVVKTYDGNLATGPLTGLTFSGQLDNDVPSGTVTGNFVNKDAGLDKPVNVDATSVSFTDSQGKPVFGYGLASSVRGDILRKTITLGAVSAANKVYDGNTAASVTVDSLNGLVGTETLVASASGTFDTKDVGTGKTVSVTASVANGSNGGLASNYLLNPNTTSTTADITRRDLTLSGVTAANKVYDGDTAASVTLGTLGGLVGSETLVTSATGSFDTKDVGTGKTVTVAISAANGSNGGLASNYNVPTEASTSADITPAPLTVRANNASKTFGNTLTFAGTEFSATGLVGSETIGSVTLNSTGAPASASVAGGPYPIVASNAAGGSFSASNYDISYVNGTLTVTPADLRAVLVDIVGNPTKVYDGNDLATLAASNYRLSGFVGTDSATVNQTVGRYDSPNAGSRTVTANLAGSNFAPVGSTDLNNYNLPVSATGAGAITPKSLTLTGLAANNKTYDGTVAATLSNPGTLSGLVGSQTLALSSTGASFDTKDAGTGKTVTVAGLALANGSGLASNYRIAPTATTTADVTPRTLTFRTVDAANKVYDGDTGASVTLGTLGGLVGSETLVTSATGSFDTKDVGTGKTVTVAISAANGSNGGLASNYNVPTEASTSADITPAPLTVRANNASKTFGNTLTFAGTEFSATGLVGSETIGSVTLNSTGAPASASVAGGPYPIVASNAAGGSFSASNYDISYVNGTLTVTPADLRAVLVDIVGNPTKVYDGNDLATLAASNYRLSGFVGTDSATVNQTAGRYDSPNAGSRTVTANLAGSNFAPVGSTDLNNYNLPVSATGAGAITPKSLILTGLAANNKTYDGTVAATLSNPGTLSGLVGSQTLALSSTGASFDTKDAGSGKTVTVAGLALANGSGLASNYRIAPTASTTADITPKTLTAANLAAANKVYDGNTAATVTIGTLTGLVGSETLGTAASGNFDTQNAGTGKTVTVGALLVDGANGGLAGNYRLAPASTTADITPKALTVGVTAADKVYDGNTAASATLGPLAGLVGSETLGVSLASANFDTKDAGAGKTVTVGGIALSDGSGLAGNYRIAPTASTTADIVPRTLSLGPVSAADKVYDGNTAASVTPGALGNLVGSETLSIAVSGNFDTKNVSNNKPVNVTIALGDGDNGGLAGNYRLAPVPSAQASITPATLTYTANAVNKLVGAPLPALSGTVGGFVAGETQATATSGSLGFVTPATPSSPAGQYAVDGTGLSAQNYSFVQAPGNATALTVSGLGPEQSDTSSQTAVLQSLAKVTPPPNWSSPSEGRVLDVFEALRANFLAEGSLFRSIPVGEMSQDSLTTLLTARDHYKKSLFAESIRRLEQDPTLADAPPCPSAKEVENGTCLITEDLKRQLRAEREALQVAAGNAPAPAAASPAPAPSASPAPTPTPGPAAAPAPQVAAVAPPAVAAPLRRRVRSASLPQIERKIAVVIGVDRYTDKTMPQLDNAVRDARSIGQLLEASLGYETIVLPNATKSTVIRTLNRLAIEAGPKDSVVVYYAGHGELVEATKLGYWQLADSAAKKPETWLSNADISRLVAQIGASQVALISDSCYSGSLVDERIRAVAGTVDPQLLLTRKTVVVMSSGGNEPVFDDGKQGHSPFAFSLMNNLRQVANWQVGGNVFERVRFAVARELPQRPRYGSASAAGHQAGGDYLFEQRQLDAAP